MNTPRRKFLAALGITVLTVLSKNLIALSVEEPFGGQEKNPSPIIRKSQTFEIRMKDFLDPLPEKHSHEPVFDLIETTPGMDQEFKLTEIHRTPNECLDQLKPLARQVDVEVTTPSLGIQGLPFRVTTNRSGINQIFLPSGEQSS